MTNQTIPPCPVCGTVPEHHDRIFCGLVNKCNCLSANRDCTIDAWTRWCAEELRRACRELGIETVEQLKAKVQPDPRVAVLESALAKMLESDISLVSYSQIKVHIEEALLRSRYIAAQRGEGV